jgi:hypothetical protein
MPHISDEKIAGLALGKLPTAESIRLQRHLCACGPCLCRLVKFEFALAFTDEITPPRLSIVDMDVPLYIRHHTADGFIYARVERSSDGWIVSHWGDQLSGRNVAGSMREANENAITAFQQMFPEHRCNARCLQNPPPLSEGVEGERPAAPECRTSDETNSAVVPLAS